MLEILLTDPIGQLSLFTVVFIIGMAVYLFFFFMKRSKQDNQENK
jgi:flagellar basal body-associated protein FliL